MKKNVSNNKSALRTIGKYATGVALFLAMLNLNGCQKDIPGDEYNKYGHDGKDQLDTPAPKPDEPNRDEPDGETPVEEAALNFKSAKYPIIRFIGRNSQAQHA